MSKICKITLSADVFTTKQNLKKHSTVQDIKGHIFFVVEDLNRGSFSHSKIDTESIYCPKMEGSIGLKQVSVNEKKIAHGFYREIRQDKVSKVGLHVNGRAVGLSWQRLEGEAFIVANGKFMVYFYPDLCSAIHGEVDANGHLKNGKFGKLVGFETPEGVALPIPKIKIHSEVTAKFFYDVSSR